MILISAIGNGDVRYHNTRHNAGYCALDVLRQALRYEGFTAHDVFKHERHLRSDIVKVKWGGGETIILQKAKGEMNTSGKVIKKVYEKYDIDHFILFHDDLDLKLGEYKIQRGKSPHCHNGVKSVEEILGTTDFLRVRIGIENRESREIPGEEYVLKRFTKEEREVLNTALFKACEELLIKDIFERWI